MNNRRSFLRNAAIAGIGLGTYPSLLRAAKVTSTGTRASETKQYVQMTKAEIADKIKGGWAGQIVGCKYGGPTEFKFNRKMIPDSVKLGFDPDTPITGQNFGALWDDVYVEITFMDIFERFGLDAPRECFLKAVAESTYGLWAGNRSARFAYLDGFQKSEPTNWATNPKVNAIDFQIEADFAGLMSPAIPVAALKFADQVGRAFSANEGFYCGAYVALMYSLAFCSTDVNYVAEKALEVLPKQSDTFRQMADIILWHKENPYDWPYAWKKHEQKYISAFDVNYLRRGSNVEGIGLYSPHNCAYILIGLLYGNGEFERTIDISTRCGFDSDCNPANSGGIVATMFGYKSIPEKFRRPLEMSANTPFLGTECTPDKLYKLGLKQAIEVLQLYGAKIDGDDIEVAFRMPAPLPFERAIETSDTFQMSKQFELPMPTSKPLYCEVDGAGVEIEIPMHSKKLFNKFASGKKGIAAVFDVYLDGNLVRSPKVFLDAYRSERDYLYANLDMPKGKHTIIIERRYALRDFPEINVNMIVYSNK